MNANDNQDTIFRKAQSITGGILSGMTKYLPHLIAVCGVAYASVLFTVNHAQEKQDTKTIWQHSGDWHTNYLNLVESVSNLNVEVQQLKDRLNEK